MYELEVTCVELVKKYTLDGTNTSILMKYKRKGHTHDWRGLSEVAVSFHYQRFIQPRSTTFILRLPHFFLLSSLIIFYC